MKLGPRRTPGGQRKLVQRRGFSVAEVAQMFGACEMTVRRAIKAGELRAIRLRGRIVVPAEAVDAMTALPPTSSARPSSNAPADGAA